MTTPAPTPPPTLEDHVPQTPSAILEYLYDGVKVNVTYEPSDGKERPPQLVKVRKVPRKKLDEYGTIVGAMDDDKEVEFCCQLIDGDKLTAVPVGWADLLDDASFAAVHKEARRINFPRYQERFASRLQVAQLGNAMPKEMLEMGKRLAQSMR